MNDQKSKASDRSFDILDGPDASDEDLSTLDIPKFSSDEIRETLHWRLEALLNAKDRIIRLADPENEPPDGVLRRNRLSAIREAAALFESICGPWIKASELDTDYDELDFIALSLRLWQPLLGIEPAHEIWNELIDEIQRLAFGDTPEILVPASRAPGSHRQPAKLTFRRLTALQWAAFLKANGLSTRQTHSAISLAYGPDWDAIRKWRQAAAKMFGEAYVSNVITNAKDGYGLRFEYPDFASSLHEFGAMYRDVAGLRRIKFEAFEAALGIGKSSS